jgi:hypothetical protein
MEGNKTTTATPLRMKNVAQAEQLRKDRKSWPNFTVPFNPIGADIKYYLQTDPRWSSIPYTVHDDKCSFCSSLSLPSLFS